MWNAEGKEQDTLAVLPDSSYAGIYQRDTLREGVNTRHRCIRRRPTAGSAYVTHDGVIPSYADTDRHPRDISTLIRSVAGTSQRVATREYDLTCSCESPTPRHAVLVAIAKP